jgi:hypothetical protein
LKLIAIVSRTKRVFASKSKPFRRRIDPFIPLSIRNFHDPDENSHCQNVFIIRLKTQYLIHGQQDISLSKAFEGSVWLEIVVFWGAGDGFYRTL